MSTTPTKSTPAAAIPVAANDSAIVCSLRDELRHLYASLAEKNDELQRRERDLHERDVSVIQLRSECDRICGEMHQRQQQQQSQQKIGTTTSNATATADAIVNLSPESDTNSTVATSIEVACDKQVAKLTANCLRLSQDLAHVRRTACAKDDLIRELRNELDIFRQIMRPLHQALLLGNRNKLSTDSLDEWRTPSLADLLHSGQPSSEALIGRVKRQAISAEPISLKAMNEKDYDTFPKSSL